MGGRGRRGVGSGRWAGVGGVDKAQGVKLSREVRNKQAGYLLQRLLINWEKLLVYFCRYYKN